MIIADNVHVNFRLGFRRRKLQALNGLSLEIRQGDFFGLVGQNGAGKSTAMYCFLGLLQPTSGLIKVMGRPPGLGVSTNKFVAYLPEEPHYHLYLTVEEATRYYSALYGRRVSQTVIDNVLERLGLAQFKKLRLSKCSKGMKQKVGIAQCLIFETKLLFLDEPTRGLDPLIVREFRDALREIHQRGATVVMNSHVLSEIEMLANRVAIIDAGKVVTQDDLPNLLTVDSGLYEITFEPNGDLPAYISSPERVGNLVKAVIAREKLYDFMEYTRAAGLNVHECSLRKNSLEDSFFKLVGEKSVGNNNVTTQSQGPRSEGLL